jgi:trans-aconitate methyltransferase
MLDATWPEGTVRPPDFDALYADEGDPWQVESSWYEHRKREVLLASLPRASYSSAWEPGCGIGVATLALAERCDHLVASDAAVAAVRRAQQRLAGLPHVDVLVSQLPDLAVREPVELLVLAEVLYYLPDLEGALDRLWSATRPGTHVVVQHWAHDPHDAYLSGPETHRLVGACAETRRARRLVTHQDEDFLLDVYEVA